VAIRFGVSSTVKNRLPRYSNFWDGTAVYSPFSPTGSYDALATYTVPSGGLSTITFAGLPTGGQYQHLQIRWLARSTVAGSEDSTTLRFNSDSGSNYSWHFLFGNGSSANASNGTSTTGIYPWAVPASSFLGSSFGVNVIDILDAFSTTKNKTTRALAGYDNNSTNGRIALASGLWMNTNAINSITLTNSANWDQYSQFALYGVKG
jgi:hypothetical protein